MKDIYIIVLAAVIGALICFTTLKKCGINKERKAVIQMVNATIDSGKYWKDKYGEEHLSKQQIVGNSQNIDILFKNYKDSIRKILNLKSKQITELTNSISTIQGSITTPLRPDTFSYHDTIYQLSIGWKGKSFEWSDTFFSIKGFIDTSTIKLFYSGIVDMSYITYWKRKHSFLGLKYGKKIYYIDASCKNPHLHINGLRNIKIN